MNNTSLQPPARIMIFICGLALIVVLFVPLWRIELNAPQYPEGLVLKMYPDKIAGNVDIINGLNHYIGMKTLHTADFPEFRILPFIICFFAAFCLLVATALPKKKWLFALFGSFVLFGIVAMIDFWRWEYNYGHELSPDAAIQVPGMAYQPPLIGYKKLLNFGAYSVPDAGGWIFVCVGLLLLSALIVHYSGIRKQRLIASNKVAVPVVAGLIFGILSCGTGPQPIRIGIDACSFCRMSIADNRFGAEIITVKGKAFKFDDMHCVLAYLKGKTFSASDIKDFYFVDFNEPHQLIPRSRAQFLKSGRLHSPMGGNVAVYDDENKLTEGMKTLGGEKKTWHQLQDEQ